jgi:hypothetical protein
MLLGLYPVTRGCIISLIVVLQRIVLLRRGIYQS